MLPIGKQLQEGIPEVGVDLVISNHIPDEQICISANRSKNFISGQWPKLLSDIEWKRQNICHSVVFVHCTYCQHSLDHGSLYSIKPA